MILLEYTKALLSSCPFIKIATDTSSADENSLSVLRMEPEPADPIIRQYIRGEADKRFAFSLQRFAAGISEEERAGSYRLFEDLCRWFEDINRRGLPGMGKYRYPLGIYSTGCAYSAQESPDSDKTLYLMQCEIHYHEGGTV